MFIERLKIILVACLVSQYIFCQKTMDTLSFFEPASSFHKGRFNTAVVISSATYTGFSIALYNTWYSQFESRGFHFFNDWGEWNHMDKMGHLYSGFFQSNLCYQGARWTGLSESSSILTGAICSGLFQTTIEVMDGFSSEWGFSISDFGANIAGIGTFALQQKYWDQQKILIKMSSGLRSAPRQSITSIDGLQRITLRQRSTDLFGSSWTERYLKDYNNQTFWLSLNLRSFFPELSVPSWLNLAIGYGSENLYGGFENRWEQDGSSFELSKDDYPRYRQFYLALDIDLDRLKPKSHFLKTLLSMANIVKIPSPAIELTSTGELQFHLLFF